MKSIIAIKAYCPTIEKKDDLAKLVNSLVPFKDQFILVILSHTIVPQEICEKVNFVLYDEENPILEDLDSTNIVDLKNNINTINEKKVSFNLNQIQNRRCNLLIQRPWWGRFIKK